jgi:hypothetical protein
MGQSAGTDSAPALGVVECRPVAGDKVLNVEFAGPQRVDFRACAIGFKVDAPAAAGAWGLVSASDA